MRLSRRLFAIALLSVAGAACVRAQAVKGPASALLPEVGAAQGAIDITADHLDYLSDQKLLVGKGNVVVRQGEDILQADYMTVQTETQDVYARGNVVYQRGLRVWKGEEFTYNLKTQKGDFGEFKAFNDPFYISATDSERISANEYLLKDVTVTTCEGDDPEVAIHAREARLVDGYKLRAKGVVLYWGVVPFMYLPKMNRNLSGHASWLEVIPGYSSRHGAYLLSAYHVKLGKQAEAITHLDYRSKRGFGGGQDFEWQATNKLWSGEFRSYYAQDDEPFKDSDEEAEFGDLVDQDRYRFKVAHFHSVSDRDYFTSELNYISDPLVLEDFFDKEYRSGVQPENRVSLSHRGDAYTAGLLLNARLNDFYENVNRLPELSLDVYRTELGDSGFYYESANSLSALERVFPDQSDSEDYDAIRFDTGHTVFYPTRHFGFLNFTPRAGYRGTYYSETIRTEQVSDSIVETDTNGVVSVTNVLRTVQSDGGGDLRSLYELGWETSFKSFKTWNDWIVMGDGDGLRHVAEPYLRYTYVPRPNLRPADLPQFDSIDALDRRHDIQIGMRNKLQTRRHERVRDLVDANVWTYYRIEKESDQEDFSDVFFDTELSLIERMPIEFDGAYDTYEGNFREFNTRANYLFVDNSRVGLEYRYRRDDQDLVSGEVDLFPEARWSFAGYWRADLDLNRLEEHSYFVRRRTRCVGYGVGVKKVDDDLSVWVQVSLLAFPDSAIDVGK